MLDFTHGDEGVYFFLRQANSCFAIPHSILYSDNALETCVI